MKKLFLLPLILAACLGCIGKTQKKSDQESSLQQSIDQEKITVEEVVVNLPDTIPSLSENENIAHNETIQRDTIIGNFHISYILKDNDDIIITQFYEYADRSVFLWVRQSNGEAILSNKEINKHTFASIIPQDDIGKYQLWYFGIEKVEEDNVTFDLNICMPDTDICYQIELGVSKDGEITMSEVEQIWEE